MGKMAFPIYVDSATWRWRLEVSNAGQHWSKNANCTSSIIKISISRQCWWRHWGLVCRAYPWSSSRHIIETWCICPWVIIGLWCGQRRERWKRSVGTACCSPNYSVGPVRHWISWSNAIPGKAWKWRKPPLSVSIELRQCCRDIVVWKSQTWIW
jgi:hypothetical protein